MTRVSASPKTRLLSPDRFRELLATAPEADDDFAADVRVIRGEVGAP
jgi:hypothetical protein